MKPVALVLAAGASRRFGGDKLAADFRGEPLLHHALRAALAAPVDRVIVVCSERVALSGWPVEVVRIASNALSNSLKAGVAAASESTGAFVFLGDMPLVPHDVAQRLAEVIGDSFAAVPRHAGKPGHPVLLSARALPLIDGLEGDRGAGALLKARDDIAFLDVETDTILQDVDESADLTRLQGRP